MKVIHVVWSLKFGGIETMLVNIVNEQVSMGAEVYIVVVNENCEQSLINAIDDRVQIIFLYRKLSSKSPVPIYRLNMELKRIDPKAVHLHDSKLFSLILVKKLQKRVCSTIHALPAGTLRRKGLLYRFLPIFNCFASGNVTNIDKIPHVFAISNAVHNQLLEMYKVPSMVVCNGIKTIMFNQRTRHVASFPIKIIMVSRLVHEKKGQDLLIHAVAKLKGKVDVTFIGEGESFEYLKNLAEELNIEQYIHIVGQKSQKEISVELANYDLFVQPSRLEGFGLTVAEAMAARVPVLVSKGQGPAEVTCGNKYGWLFENGDIDDLAEKIGFICTHYTEADTKADKALKYVCDTYDVKVTAATYLKEYKNFV